MISSTDFCGGCGHLRLEHRGGRGQGACQASVAVFDHTTKPTDDTAVQPCGCVRWQRPKRLTARGRKRAEALRVHNTPMAVLFTEWDATRPRSRKTAEARAEGKFGVGPSDASSCRKSIQYRENPPEDYTPLAQDKKEAVMGTIIEDGWRKVMRFHAPWMRFGVKIHVPGLDKPGEADAYDPRLRRIIDCKCTPYDEPALMADGSEKPSGDLRPGDIIVAWDEKTNALTSAAVTWTQDNGVQPIYRIQASGGRSLRVTAEHPILIGTRTSSSRTHYQWVKAQDVREDMHVVLALGWEGSATSEPSLIPEGMGGVCGVKGCDRPIVVRPKPKIARRKQGYIAMCTGHSARRYKGVDTPELRRADEPLSSSDAYLLGALVGDGTLAAPTASFTSADDGIVNAVSDALSIWGGTLTKQKVPYSYAVSFGKQKYEVENFRRWLDIHDVRHGARSKRIPLAVRSGSTEVRAAFLAGLIDTDGTVAGWQEGSRLAQRVVVTTSSAQLARDTMVLFAALDCKAMLYHTDTTDSWQVTVSGTYSVRRLAGLLPLRGPKAHRIFDAAAKPQSRSTGDRPVHYNLARVTSVELQPSLPTIAVEVAGFHTYVVSGIVTHNTAGEWKWEYGISKGVDENHLDQVMMYALGLIAMGTPVEEVEVRYIRRANGEDESFVFAYDEARAHSAVGRLHLILEDLEAGRELPRDEPGPGLSALCDRLCPARAHCWNLDTVPDGRSPQGWMRFGEVRIDDPDTASLLADYVAAGEAVKPFEEAKAETKVLVEGIGYGRYGDYTYRKTGGKTKPVPDPEQQLAWLLAEVTKPDGERITDPALMPQFTRNKTSSLSVEIKRVRQADLDKEARTADEVWPEKDKS